MTDPAVPHRPRGRNTRLVHAGRPPGLAPDSVALPVFHSSTYRTDVGEAPRSRGEVRYIRYNNTPNQQVLAARLADLHGAEAGLATGSGMAAITATALALHRAGDHVIVLESLYGATQEFFLHDLPRWGIESTLVPPDDPRAWQAALRDETRSIYAEAVTNPLLRVPDHVGLTDFARRNGLVSVIDNTVATPALFRPLEWGYDVVIESCSKSIGGHSDLVAGAVVGRRERVEAAGRMLAHLGGTLDPHTAYLTLRGLVTLDLRVRRAGETALALAEWLRARPDVLAVNHAGGGGVLDGPVSLLSFRLAGGVEAAESLLAGLGLVAVAPSLGGPESLITRPAVTAHSGLSAAEREAAGIPEDLLRLSVGLEDVEDLVADLDRALGVARAPASADGAAA